jgi:hypothetical protein
MKEVNLNGRLFTWSNERAHPTLERIDRTFVTAEWEVFYPFHDLQALASQCSDHAPLLLRTDNCFSAKKRFQFQSYWPRFPGYREVVQRAWSCPLRHANSFHRLDWLSRNTARALKSYSDKSIGCIKIQLEIAKEVVHRLEAARDKCTLAAHEESLRQELKLKSLGLASLQHSIVRHQSRLLWLSEGDTPTRFFHVHASARCRKNFIRSFEQNGQTIVDDQLKVDMLFSFFDDVLGAPPSRVHDIALDGLDLPRSDLTGLGARFTEEEVWGVIKALPHDKAPGPDGFSAGFLQSAWDIIRLDLMMAFDVFWHLNTRSLHLVNNAFMVLLPKKQDAVAIKDYMPIALIYYVGKLLSKVLANRLAPKLSGAPSSKAVSFKTIFAAFRQLPSFFTPGRNRRCLSRSISPVPLIRLLGPFCLRCFDIWASPSPG